MPHNLVDETSSQCPDQCPKQTWVFRLLVFAQFALVITLVWATLPVQFGWIEWIVSLAGVGLGLWSIVTMGRHINVSPRLRENVPLQTSGPYRFVRHPMYLALLIFAAAWLIESFSLYTAFLWLALLLVLACKIYYEEQLLRKRFSGYALYCNKTRRIIPFIF